MQNCLYWLNTISDPEIKSKALSNYNNPYCDGAGSTSTNDDNEPIDSLYDAIEQSFVWLTAPEGPYYWIEFQNTLQP